MAAAELLTDLKKCNIVKNGITRLNRLSSHIRDYSVNIQPPPPNLFVQAMCQSVV